MSQQELLNRVVQILTEAGIEYMVTGSFASSLQGEPRSTHDIDLVVNLRAAQIPPLLQHFTPPDFYLSESAIRDAIRHRKMFNLLDVTEGEKVDFWILKESPFDQLRFARRRLVPVDEGVAAYVTTPEDTILTKLRWTQQIGGSEKHLHDALRVYEVQGKILDRAYLDHWAKELHVEDLWQQIQQQAEWLDAE